MSMKNIKTLGFDTWFKDKIDLSKTVNFKIERVVSELNYEILFLQQFYAN